MSSGRHVQLRALFTVLRQEFASARSSVLSLYCLVALHCISALLSICLLVTICWQDLGKEDAENLEKYILQKEIQSLKSTLDFDADIADEQVLPPRGLCVARLIR